MFDAHSHLVNTNSIVCTAVPELLQGSCFAKAVGLLPFYYDEQNLAILEKLICENETLLIGEVGLDRRAKMSLDEQEVYLSRIFEMALKYKRAVILHCVGADGRMLKLIKKYKELKFLYHGFNGSYEMAKELVRLNVYLSIRPGFSTTRVLEDKSLMSFLLVESDYDGQSKEEYEQVLKAHYQKVATTMGLSVEELERQNYERGKIFTNQ